MKAYWRVIKDEKKPWAKSLLRENTGEHILKTKCKVDIVVYWWSEVHRIKEKFESNLNIYYTRGCVVYI